MVVVAIFNPSMITLCWNYLPMRITTLNVQLWATCGCYLDFLGLMETMLSDKESSLLAGALNMLQPSDPAA